VHAVLGRIRARRRKSLKSVIDGVPPGSIIHGASNWESIPGHDEVRFDLESIGVTEALKPIPPAYGIYRGSVRITDTDIRFEYPRLVLIADGCRGVR